MLLWLWSRSRGFISVGIIIRMIHFGTLNGNVSDEAIKVVEGSDDIGFNIAFAVGPGSRRTRVEV